MLIGTRAPSQQPQRPKARVSLAADDDVVVDADLQLGGGLAFGLNHGDAAVVEQLLSKG